MILVWHGHHNVLISIYADEAAIAWRLRVIEDTKPAKEQPLRKRLLHRVVGQLPPAVLLAVADWEKARADWGKAQQENMPAILALHAQECPDCPWDGQSIFPREAQP